MTTTEPTTRRFGQYPGGTLPNVGIPTAKASYEDGWWTGCGWNHKKNNYVPGGPSVTTVQPHERQFKNRDWVAFCEATKENHEEWLRGWHDGCQMNWMPPELFIDHIAVLGYN